MAALKVQPFFLEIGELVQHKFDLIHPVQLLRLSTVFKTSPLLRPYLLKGIAVC